MIRSLPFAGILLCAISLATVGCAHESAEDRQLEDMRGEIGKIQEDNDKFEKRLNSVENAVTEDNARPQQKTPARGGKGESSQVVELAPGETGGGDVPAAEDTENDAPRPSIRISGVAPAPAPRSARNRHGLTGQTSGEQRVEADGVESDDLNGQDPTTRPSALDPEAKRSYDAALSLVNQKKYNEALDALSAFLVKYPDHPNADNAMYWRGECYFAQGEYGHAADQFEGVLARFPLGNKVPDALLKLGMSREKLGDTTAARAAYDKLEHDWPRSDAARRIPARTATPNGPKGPKETP
jgi:tol-pal system protein YbgF